jgi:hypothetical protein
MALVATVGASTSNSYVTQAEATTYFANGMHAKNATWSALDSSSKDEFLIQATLMIDSLRIKGQKNDTALTSGVPDQRLKFPRTDDVDDATEYIPLDVKHATYEQAIHLATAGGGSETRTQLIAQGVTSVSVGDVSESYDSASAGSLNPLNMLAPLPRQILLGGGYIQRTAAFVK